MSNPSIHARHRELLDALKKTDETIGTQPDKYRDKIHLDVIARIFPIPEPGEIHAIAASRMYSVVTASYDPETEECDYQVDGDKCARLLTDYFPNRPAIDALEKQIQDVEYKLEQAVLERDDAEQAISNAYYLVLGRSPEWSNEFGYGEACEDIKDAVDGYKAHCKQRPAIDDKGGYLEHHA